MEGEIGRKLNEVAGTEALNLKRLSPKALAEDFFPAILHPSLLQKQEVEWTGEQGQDVNPSRARL